jgi:hypothetical protein
VECVPAQRCRAAKRKPRASAVQLARRVSLARHQLPTTGRRASFQAAARGIRSAWRGQKEGGAVKPISRRDFVAAAVGTSVAYLLDGKLTFAQGASAADQQRV